MFTNPNALQASTIGILYPQLLFSILNSGEEVRIGRLGVMTRELRGVRLHLLDARDNILCHPHRTLNYRFMLAEWLWIMAGRNDVETVAQYNSKIAQFSDDGEVFAGAYGPRLLTQWAYLVDTLRKDHSSRQAVATIWTPIPVPSKDIPCTVSCQFLIRKGMLHGIFNMRSSDAWLGIPYDVFNFAQITNSLAGELGVDTGELIMNLGSSHLYANNYEDAQKVAQHGSGTTIRSPRLRGISPASASMALGGNAVTYSWGFYRDALHTKTSFECQTKLMEGEKL